MFSKEVMYECRKANTYDIVMSIDSRGWKHEGNYIRSREHDSCCIRRDGAWAYGSQGLSGRNPVDFLQQYYGYGFVAAVNTVIDCCGIRTEEKAENYGFAVEKKAAQSVVTAKRESHIEAPTVGAKPWNSLFTYLCGIRGIDRELVQKLIDQGIVYETDMYGYRNICFINPHTKHFEIVGTNINQRFKRISDADSYWCFTVGNPENAIICESAIDAMSLYQLNRYENVVYISIGGSTRRNLINKILEEYPDAVLAVDNDAAGDKAAAMFPELVRIVSVGSKDWNEMLVSDKNFNS